MQAPLAHRLKWGLCLLLALCTAHPALALEVNQGTEADLDSLSGVGPALTRRILEARRSGAFQSWPDLMARVKGIQPKTARKLSAAGLTVQGQSFEPEPEPAAPNAVTAPR